MKVCRLIGLLSAFGAVLFVSTPVFAQEGTVTMGVADLEIYCSAISPLATLVSGVNNLKSMQSRVNRKIPAQRPIYNSLDKKIRSVNSAIKSIKGKTYRAPADMNRDGRIDQNDIDALMGCFSSTVSASNNCLNADLDGSKSLGANDLSIMLGYKDCFERSLVAAAAIAQ